MAFKTVVEFRGGVQPLSRCISPTSNKTVQVLIILMARAAFCAKWLVIYSVVIVRASLIDNVPSNMRKCANFPLILRMHKVSFGPLLSIRAVCSIQRFC